MTDPKSDQDMSNQSQELKSNSWDDYITTPIIFLIGGKAGTGKTTSANLIYDILTEKHVGSYALQSFAAILKGIAKDSFGWNGIKTSKGRVLLQGIGQTGRTFEPDIWVRQALQVIIDDYPIPVNTVSFDDWRFPNELKYVRENYLHTHKVVTIRIDAPSREVLKGTSEYKEISETSLPITNKSEYYDYFLDNEGSKNELENELREIIKEITEK